MKYKQLGNSGLIVSELCLGAMTFGSGDYYGFKYTVGQQEANEMIAKVTDRGVNFFDTAVSYAKGESELILGKALGKKRKDNLIATKIAFRSSELPFRAGINLQHLIASTEESLTRLNTDYIDLLLLHNDDPLTPVDEVARALESLVQSGKVRYIGLSNFQAWKAATLVQLQKDLGYHRLVASQMHYSLLNREVEHEFIPMSLHHGLGMMVWSPLSSGFLTGKYTRENPAPADSRLNSFDLGLFDREKGYDVVDKVKEIAAVRKTSAVAVSIDFQQFSVQPWQIYFMVPGQVHAWNFEGEVDGYVINFSVPFFQSFLLKQDYLEQFPFFSGVLENAVINLPEHLQPAINHLLENIIQEAESADRLSLDMVRSLLVQLFILIGRLGFDDKGRTGTAYNYTLLRKFLKLIEKNYATLKLPKEYAGLLFITPNHLNALCNQMLDKSAGEVIRDHIILEAKRMLVNLDLSITEVSYKLNFNDNSYFSRFFKKYTGSSPEEFRYRFTIFKPPSR